MFWKVFRKNLLAGCFALMLVTSLSGCVYVVIGTLGALGGYVVSPDTVEGIVENKTYEEAWEAAVEIISVMGLIEEQNEGGGVLFARVRGAKATVTVYRVSEGSVRVTVKARKTFLPKIRLAQDIYVKIVNYLEGEDAV